MWWLLVPLNPNMFLPFATIMEFNLWTWPPCFFPWNFPLKSDLPMPLSSCQWIAAEYICLHLLILYILSSSQGPECEQLCVNTQICRWEQYPRRQQNGSLMTLWSRASFILCYGREFSVLFEPGYNFVLISQLILYYTQHYLNCFDHRNYLPVCWKPINILKTQLQGNTLHEATPDHNLDLTLSLFWFLCQYHMLWEACLGLWFSSPFSISWWCCLTIDDPRPNSIYWMGLQNLDGPLDPARIQGIEVCQGSHDKIVGEWPVQSFCIFLLHFVARSSHPYCPLPEIWGL